MFGTGTSMNNVRNVELPKIQSPKAPAGASSTENNGASDTDALQDSTNPLKKEWEIMDRVLKAQKIKQAQSLVEPENSSQLQKRSISPIRRSLEPIKEEPTSNTSPRKQNNSSKLGVTKQTSEEKQIKIREFVNKARLQDIKEIPIDSLGFEVNKIDYSSFRRNFGSLMYQEAMKEERKKIMSDTLEKKQKQDQERYKQSMAKFQPPIEHIIAKTFVGEMVVRECNSSFVDIGQAFRASRNPDVNHHQMTLGNMMTETAKKKLTVNTDKADTFLASSKASFFNKTPRIISPMENYQVAPVPKGGGGGSRTTRNQSPVRRSNNQRVTQDEVQEAFEKVMDDERSYDQIIGPDRLKMRLEEQIQEAAKKGRHLKVKHITNNYGYSSFETEPTVKPLKFDQVLSREKANKPYEKVPEGAPFWKYNVKDAVISVPVKSYKFSQNLDDGHSTVIQYPDISDQDKIKSHKCGRMQRRLDSLMCKYDELHECTARERYHEFEKTETQKINTASKDLEDSGVIGNDEKYFVMSEVQSERQNRNIVIQSDIVGLDSEVSESVDLDSSPMRKVDDMNPQRQLNKSPSANDPLLVKAAWIQGAHGGKNTSSDKEQENVNLDIYRSSPTIGRLRKES